MLSLPDIERGSSRTRRGSGRRRPAPRRPSRRGPAAGTRGSTAPTGSCPRRPAEPRGKRRRRRRSSSLRRSSPHPAARFSEPAWHRRVGRLISTQFPESGPLAWTTHRLNMFPLSQEESALQCPGRPTHSTRNSPSSMPTHTHTHPLLLQTDCKSFSRTCRGRQINYENSNVLKVSDKKGNTFFRERKWIKFRQRGSLRRFGSVNKTDTRNNGK